MAVAFKDATGANNSGTSTWTVTKPAWVADGDMLILFATTDSTHTITTAPSGFTQIESTIGTGSDDSSLTIWWKIASSEPSTWSIVFGGSESGATGLLGYTGHSGTAPESVAGDRASGTAQAAPAINPSVDNAMVVAIYGADPSGAPTGSPDTAPTPDAVERLDFANSGLAHIYAQDYLQTTHTSLSLTATMSASDTYCRISIAILPAAGASTLTPASITVTRAQGSLQINPKLILAAIARTKALGTLAVDWQVEPLALTRTRAQGAPKISPKIVMTAIARTRAQGSTVVFAQLLLLPLALTRTRTQGSPTVNTQARPAGLVHSRTLGSIQINQRVPLTSLIKTRGQGTINVIVVITLLPLVSDPIVGVRTRTLGSIKINPKIFISSLDHNRSLGSPSLPGPPSVAGPDKDARRTYWIYR
jgi:hypothetical protein